MAGRSNPSTISTKLQRVASLSRERPQMVWNTLAHHIDIEWLHAAYSRTRKDGATGIDGQTARDYEANLAENLQSLLERFKSGRYRAPPVRRVLIPKGDGKQRPIGIPTFEDKVLQRAVVMLLEAVYEQDFLDCSYGFRPGRSAHRALVALRNHLMEMHGGWVLEIDIRSFFDTVDHGHLRSFLDKRVCDGVLRRAIGKWLSAGVLEEGSLLRSGEGTPQGGVISPLLANIYLHEVLDLWFEHEVKPCMGNQTALIRYADDAVMVFQSRSDAERVLRVLPKRFAKYGLTLHPQKTRLVRFERPPRSRSKPPRDSKPGAFDFLGFTLYWGRSRKGNNVVQLRTGKRGFTGSLRRLWEWCRNNRHLPIREQHARLSRKLRGHYAYYGVTGNIRRLSSIAHRARMIWRYWLRRRSWAGTMPHWRFIQVMNAFPFPSPRIVHNLAGEPLI